MDRRRTITRTFHERSEDIPRARQTPLVTLVLTSSYNTRAPAATNFANFPSSRDAVMASARNFIGRRHCTARPR